VVGGSRGIVLNAVVRVHRPVAYRFSEVRIIELGDFEVDQQYDELERVSEDHMAKRAVGTYLIRILIRGFKQVPHP
jgi:hypothetical protein